MACSPKSQWSALLNLLKDRLDQATKLVPDNGMAMSLKKHNAYYRAVFDRVREEVASRTDIPNAVMNPPTQMITLTFHGGWNKAHCLGCLDWHGTDDIIHVELHAKKNEPDGVTKDDLLECICKVLYGGVHMVDPASKKKTGIKLSDLNWKGTTVLCNLIDNMVYVGYMPVDPEQQQDKVVLEGGALGKRMSPVQGWDDDYFRRLTKNKGWTEEDWDNLTGCY
ncbi:hypothetical protein F4821DRAFT_255056 [Hypoxylon rubiginosum]|uniref:Uncharacterized protein n=1 Tax=Hypoxylon rubiginosum TaxID=110542 RepID=A0ACC0DFL6_9PEZI|nr:hypothetical protein F4821DRAFT_255056 [Hypoxylon rubiginosum]